MKRIDTPTGATDLFGPGKHGFKDGDPVSGDPATVLNAAWFNAVQEELVNAVEGAGLTLDSEDRSQLLQAIRRLNDSGVFGGIVFNALVITAADHGKFFSLLTNSFTVTLPPLGAVPDGFRVTFHKGSAAGVQSVATSGGDRFEGGSASIDLGVLGDVLDLVKHSDYWYRLTAPADRDWPGLVRLANSSDTVAGSETQRAVTPAGALALLNAYGLAIDGVNAVNPLLATDANAATESGFHITDGGAVNLPIGASAGGCLLVMTGSPSGSPAIAQIYLDSGNRLFSRRRNGATWGSWREIWSGVEASSLQTAPGYQRLPSGLILQWGFSQNLSPNANIVFPITFPNNIRCLTLGPVTHDLDITMASSNVYLSGFTIITNKSGTHNCYWLAVGN